MKSLLKTAREAKGIKTRELSQLSGIDQALISKFESGDRNPTKSQLKKISEILEIDFETIVVLWLKEKILRDVGCDALALKAIKAAEAEISGTTIQPEIAVDRLLQEMDALRAMLLKEKK